MTKLKDWIYRTVLLCIVSLYVMPAVGQYIEIGGSLGGTTYQGDINHFGSKLSIQGARFLNSFHIGYQFSEYYSLKMRFSSSSIGAYDNASVDPWRRQRNLLFRSDLREVAIIQEIELLDVLSFFRKFNLKPYLITGVAWFSFNPQGKYQGRWIDLQPLGTEGQGLPGYDAPYKLHQWSIPVGLGLRYYVNDNLFISAEVSPRITFTDYLDDVSGSYPDMELLRQYRGDQAVYMSYQGNQLSGEHPPLSEISGIGRGNPRENDWYIFNSFTVGYRFDPMLYLKKRRAFRHGRKCTFF